MIDLYLFSLYYLDTLFTLQTHYPVYDDTSKRVTRDWVNK